MRSPASRLPLVFLFAVLAASALPARAETPDDAVRAFLAKSYDGRFDELPATPNARMQPFQQQVRNILRVRCVRIDGVAIAAVETTPDRVTLEADVVIEKSDGAWSASDFVPLRFALVRHDDRWLVDEVLNRDDEFAGRLLQAAAADRDRLLREEPRRLTRGLDRALYSRAMALLNSGDFPRAGVVSALALDVARTIGDRGGEALAIGAASYSAKREAIMGMSEESLAIAKEAGEPDVLARAWYDYGRNAVRAIPKSARGAIVDESYRKARALAARAEEPTILIRILYSLANIAANDLADFVAARRYVDEAMLLAREAGDEAGQVALEMVLTTIYVAQNDNERALFHQALATELAEKTGALAYPTLLVRWGSMLTDMERYDEAEAVFARAVMRDESGRMTSRIKSMPGNHLGSALTAMAVIAAHKGELAEAECLIRESALHHGGRPERYLYLLAPQYTMRGDDARAVSAALASLAALELHPPQQADALMCAARAYRNMGLIESGLAVVLEAIEVREALDTKTAGDERQQAFAAKATSEVYELAAELLLRKGEPLEALAFLERGRARVITDIVANGRPGLAAEADARLREQQAVLDREVARLTAELDRAQAASDRADRAERLHRARETRASFLDGVRARAERSNAIRRRIDAEGVLAIARRLPARTVAVEYVIGEHDLQIFVVDRRGVRVRTKHVEHKLLDERVSAFLKMLESSDLRVEKAARELHALLVAPIEKDIAGADALLIVPDDSLWGVPFAALVDRRGRFLVESKAVFYAPSLGAWASLTDARKRKEPAPVSLLAIANPTRGEAVDEVPSSYRGAKLGALPDAEHEVDALRTLYDARRSVVLKRDEATEARTKAALREAAVAHFATHAILDDANPMYSRLMLAREGNGEDGWLESWEVARLDVNPDLVVLSACETARGTAGGGEGVVGLSWSFFLAGALSTVATQWNVASDSTARFMIAFHRFLRGAVSNDALHEAQAIRYAQLQCLRDARTSHPFHWAPFVLIGDPSAKAER